MKTVFLIVIAFVIVGAIAGYLFGKDGEKEEMAKVGATFSFITILNFLPFIVTVLIIVAIVKSCS